MYPRFPERMFEKPSDVLTVGQEITAKIVDLNVEEKKISLSMKLWSLLKQKKDLMNK